MSADLHICPECDSELVYPVTWNRSSYKHYWVERRCPECEWWTEDEHHERDIEDFDAVLDEGTDVLIDALKQIVYRNMEDEIEVFVDALRNDYVLPEDLGAPWP